MRNPLIPKIEAQLQGLPVPVALQLPAGERVGANGAKVTLSFQDWSSLATMAAGQIGRLAEDFVESRVQLQGRMRDLMEVAARLLPGHPGEQASSGWWAGVLRRAKSLAAHSPARDAEQIQFHYDVSDDFYALWLDDKRVYSCAYFRDAGMGLSQAQEAKLDHICKKLMLHGGERFLDIGAGWGGLLLWAAENYGVDATGITLSRNQHAHVNREIERRGLSGRVRMLLCDYRDLQAEPFDKIASVGMFEHVGRANMPTYFRRIHELLRPGGLVLNHGITGSSVHHDQLGAGMGDFIEKYIFPGGELLHVSHVLRELAGAGLEMVDTENLRPHYARTLWAWSDALEARLDEARQVLASTARDAGTAERVLRAYRLYLAGSAMSFEHDWISLHQMLASRPSGSTKTGPMTGAQSAYPFNRGYMYR
ncbi:cyclopropane-fatty-acyl-phospholipid synthase family protein [Pseudorhodoferax sp. Leaf274]|uniref:SAM-dependent methyltransferase n=1 Tax=Pseudorhodoferax sp. Leaf274 TaxID=1736318 RepID=UPI000703AB9F|nr:cyclopropane-fatty-acyl-phospholipid synthase family protein [Pseudorhodoferax sp. Leaf274]KQP46196.1 cyclopropane-fatty-acyl-phospholipid synthase [Pseudorhodoferax sp. Leaf274]